METNQGWPEFDLFPRLTRAAQFIKNLLPQLSGEVPYSPRGAEAMLADLQDEPLDSYAEVADQLRLPFVMNTANHFVEDIGWSEEIAGGRWDSEGTYYQEPYKPPVPDVKGGDL